MTSLSYRAILDEAKEYACLASRRSCIATLRSWGAFPFFVGTRVPVKTLHDYLAAGDPLDDFLNDFPSVTREQAIAARQPAHALSARVAA